jgi:N6-adenosine-specific RNA methylase IME4
VEAWLSRKKNIMSSWAFGDLKPMRYGLIMADCPWSFKTYSPKGWVKSAQRHYSCMTLEDIKLLPVRDLAAPDCCLFLWATFPMLPQALEVMSAWGFSYRSGGVWHKRTSGGKTAFGTGYRVRGACEPFLLGFIGNPKNSRSERNLIEGTVREHSRKPETAYEWAERYLPDAHRCELFSRQRRPGWECFGNDVDHFQEDAA